jgi:hypothetical protein
VLFGTIDPVRTRGALVPPLLLISVATAQLITARTSLLTPWKGGGFGMFSTVDAPHTRFLRIALETPDGDRRVSLPESWREEAAVLRAAPTQARVEALAATLASQTWVPETWIPAEVEYAERLRASGVDDSAVPVEAVRDLSVLGLYRPLLDGEIARGQIVRVAAIRVEVWRYRFDGDAVRLDAKLLTRARAPATRVITSL